MYSVGFAGMFWMKQQSIGIAKKNFDKMIFYLNFAFNGDAISGYVVPVRLRTRSRRSADT